MTDRMFRTVSAVLAMLITLAAMTLAFWPSPPG